MMGIGEQESKDESIIEPWGHVPERSHQSRCLPKELRYKDKRYTVDEMINSHRIYFYSTASQPSSVAPPCTYRNDGWMPVNIKLPTHGLERLWMCDHNPLLARLELPRISGYGSSQKKVSHRILDFNHHSQHIEGCFSMKSDGHTHSHHHWHTGVLLTNRCTRFSPCSGSDLH